MTTVTFTYSAPVMVTVELDDDNLAHGTVTRVVVCDDAVALVDEAPVDVEGMTDDDPAHAEIWEYAQEVADFQPWPGWSFGY